MNRHRLILAALVLLLAVGVVAAYLLWPAPPASAINRDSAALVKIGQTRAQVERILGGPMRDESTGHLISDGDMAPDSVGQFHLNSTDPLLWLSDSVQVLVHFDSDGFAVSVTVAPVRRQSWVARMVGPLLGW